jgi:deazaflavin-dependent oxidoreductase (nitroreductase family)
MDDAVFRALRSGLTCEITTTGRASGQPRRLEIWYFMIDGQVYLTGTPGRRDWYANMLVHPGFIFHVKEGARVDLPARAVPITDPAERWRIMDEVRRQNSWFAAQGDGLDAWVAGSPLVAVVFEPGGAAPIPDAPDR